MPRIRALDIPCKWLRYANILNHSHVLANHLDRVKSPIAPPLKDKGMLWGFDQQGWPLPREVDGLISQIPTLLPIVPGWGITLIGALCSLSCMLAAPLRLVHNILQCVASRPEVHRNATLDAEIEIISILALRCVASAFQIHCYGTSGRNATLTQIL